jgi:hypothetical protein
MISPPLTITCASTDGTNNTLMGCSGEPMAAMGSSVGGGTSVGGTSVGGGAAGSWVGASVAGAQEASASARTVIVAKNRYSDFFIFFSS